MDVIKFGLKYFKRNMPLTIFIQLVSFVAMGADLMLPMISQMLIDYAIGNNESDGKGVFSFLLNGKYGQTHSMKLFFTLAFVFMALLIGRIILVYIRNIVRQKIGLDLETDLRVATYQKLNQLDSNTIAQFNTGELLTTINSDTIMFKELFCRMIPNIADSIFVLATAVYLLTKINAYLLIIPLIMAPFFVVALLKFKKAAMLNYRNIRNGNSRMNLTVQENIEAVRLVRSFTNEDFEKEKFDASNENLKNAYISQINLSSNRGLSSAH